MLIATGSSPQSLPFIKFDHKQILSSDDILRLNTLPQRLAIIGGGVIGLEFASLMNDLGADVVVIEANDRVLPTESTQVASLLKEELTNRGVTFYENIQLTKDHFNQTDKGVTINISDEPVQFDKVLVAIGRKPNTNDIGLNNTQIKTSDAGHIITNAYQQTEDKHIYAAGDCIGQLQLARRFKRSYSCS